MRWLQELGPQRTINVTRPHVISSWAGFVLRVFESGESGKSIAIDAYPTLDDAIAASDKLFGPNSIVRQLAAYASLAYTKRAKLKVWTRRRNGVKTPRKRMVHPL